ncbi:fimbria/pilus outer membrane usher protein [Dyella sp. 2RAB6]|uniref:fimbria/pilus outer membrane usher protein n=1 Tax=Dyella sp. 2RAB6 TaxID=3232992 RepID=UPI003F90D53D
MMRALAGAALTASPALAFAEAAEGAPIEGARSVDFDPVFLPGGVGSADLARFSRGAQVAPGTYRVNIYVNDMPQGSDNVEFRVQSGKGRAVPCLTYDFMARLVDKLPPEAATQACLDLAALVPSATVRFDVGEQRLDIGIPQAAMRRSVRGYVDPSRWDNGITAGMLNYQYNWFQRQGGGHEDGQAYLGLTGGFNAGAWHFRHQSSFQWSKADGLQWQNLRNYVQRDVTALKSQLVMGDFSTSGDLFDTAALRGFQLSSDERMLPDSQQGYAPVVRGIAASNAKVSVRQNGYVIYETTVAAGPFRIDDLYPTGYGGDLEVSVLEADGREQKFTVPYASVARMLRPGSTRFSVAAGAYREGGLDEHPWVAQATWQRGLSNRVTAYAGAVVSKNYQAVQLGSALNTPIGAFGLDLTHARTVVNVPGLAPKEGSGGSDASRRHTAQGDSLRLSYSKNLNATGTNLTVAAYRYSTRDYYSLHDAVLGSTAAGADAPHRRNSAQITLSQSIGQSGSLYFTGSTQNYWGRASSDLQYQLGYNSSTRWFNYSISAARQRDGTGRVDNRLYATVSIPLGRGMLDTGISFGRGGHDEQASYSGSSGDRVSYGASVSRDQQGVAAFNASGSYRSPYALLNGSLALGQGYRQYGFSATGGMLIHSGGVTLGQSIGDTVALIKAPDAAGASVSSYPGVKLDKRGYAIVPYLIPYRRNQIELDPQGLSADVELLEGSHEAVPRSNAVIMATFATRQGRVAVIDVAPMDGMTIPFGSDVLDEGGQAIGVVSQGGRILVRGVSDEGQLTIPLPQSKSCRIRYRLPPRQKGAKGVQDYARLQASCDPAREETVALPGK